MEKAVLKYLIFFIFLSLTAMPSFSQKVQVDKRLNVAFDADYLSRLQSSPSQVTLEMLNFNLDHAWYKADEVIEKKDGFEYLYYRDAVTGERSGKMVDEIDWNNVNIYEFYFEQSGSYRNFYRVGNTDTVLGFYSLIEVADMFNKEKGGNHE